MSKKFKNELYNRCLDLTINVINLIVSEKSDYKYTGLFRQIINSVSSIGANLSEGNGAVSKKEFITFMNHSRKSAMESLYWFDVLMKSDVLGNGKVSKCNELRNECEELLKLFTKIILTTKKNNNLKL